MEEESKQGQGLKTRSRWGGHQEDAKTFKVYKMFSVQFLICFFYHVLIHVDTGKLTTIGGLPSSRCARQRGMLLKSH